MGNTRRKASEQPSGETRTNGVVLTCSRRSEGRRVKFSVETIVVRGCMGIGAIARGTNARLRERAVFAGTERVLSKRSRCDRCRAHDEVSAGSVQAGAMVRLQLQYIRSSDSEARLLALARSTFVVGPKAGTVSESPSDAGIHQSAGRHRNKDQRFVGDAVSGDGVRIAASDFPVADSLSACEGCHTSEPASSLGLQYGCGYLGGSAASEDEIRIASHRC